MARKNKNSKPETLAGSPPAVPAPPDPELRTYPPGTPFPGVIGRTLDESSPAWPEPRRARRGAPNVVLFVLDDVGYGQLSPFGGLCETPTLDRLAAAGLRYANFHTTALCSPTRGCLLSGRNHHTLGLSAITELSMGFPAHDAAMGPQHGFLSEVLLEHGYNTFAVGKWHLTPTEATTPAGPFHRWPLGRGFERYYGFLGGDTDQWYPALVHDNHHVPAPRTPEQGYHLNADLADHAIAFVRDAHVNAPEKPFFLYYATGAAHAPHHVEREWIARQAGRFDGGWDAYREAVFARQKRIGLLPPNATLSSRDPDVPAWESLPAPARRLYARQMEVFAAFLAQTDHHFGRFLAFLEKLGVLDDTLVLVLSDNGASAEGGVHGTFNEALFFNDVPERLEDNLRHLDAWGGPSTFPHYAWGWTWAGDTPFRRWKRETYRGGVTDPLVIAWPRGIRAAGEVRTAFVHAIDVAPTVLDALGIAPPAVIRGVPQSPVHGASFAHTFDDAAAPARRATQYFEMFGHRALVHEGWKATCPFPGPSFAEAAEQGRSFGMPLTAAILDALDADGWELYDLVADPAETRNLAATQPSRLRAMVRQWYAEAGRYGVFPLVTADLARMNLPRPTVARPRTRYRYFADGAPVPFGASPKLFNRPYTVVAEVVVPAGRAEGVLLTQGGRHGGWAFLLVDGRLCHVHNFVGLERFVVTAAERLPPGPATLRYTFEPSGPPALAEGRGVPGWSRLWVGDRLVGELALPYSTPRMFSILGLSCGYAAFDTVDPGLYRAPFRFTGTLEQVVLDVSGAPTRPAEAELRRLVTQQ